MPLIENLLAKLQRHPKRVVFPEGTDPRIIQSARQFSTRRCGVPILLGDRSEIKERATALDIRLEGIRIMEPERSDDLDLFLPMVDALPRFAGLSASEKKQLVLNRHNFAALMVASGRVDALVGGATSTTASGLRSLFRIVPLQPLVKSASSMLILDQENLSMGSNGLLFLGDCGVIPEPSAEQLADIAIATAITSHHLTNETSRIAFLSFTSMAADCPHPAIAKVREAVNLTRTRISALGLDAYASGELQLDAAVSRTVARQKDLPEDGVTGMANVLIFPDLNAGNIASKMIQHVAGARCYGHFVAGLSRPCAEISRGSHTYDIFGTAVVAACQAIDRSFLFDTATPHN